MYSGLVPVLYGSHRDDVADVLPPKSYIHVEDFNNPKELVEYLHYLDKNVTAYAEYFEWRSLAKFFKENDYINLNSSKIINEASKNELELLKKFTQIGPSGFCRLCKMLHSNHTSSMIVSSIDDMLNSDRPECLNVSLARKMMGLPTENLSPKISSLLCCSYVMIFLYILSFVFLIDLNA